MSIICFVLSSVLNPLWKKSCRRAFMNYSFELSSVAPCFFSVEDLDFHHSTMHCKGLLGLSKSLGFGFLWHTAAEQHKLVWGGRNYHHWSQFFLPSAGFQQVCNCITCHVLEVMCSEPFSPAKVCSTKESTFFPFCICYFSVFSKV
jgi:hypothetical protein